MQPGDEQKPAHHVGMARQAGRSIGAATARPRAMIAIDDRRADRRQAAPVDAAGIARSQSSGTCPRKPAAVARVSSDSATYRAADAVDQRRRRRAEAPPSTYADRGRCAGRRAPCRRRRFHRRGGTCTAASLAALARSSCTPPAARHRAPGARHAGLPRWCLRVAPADARWTAVRRAVIHSEQHRGYTRRVTPFEIAPPCRSATRCLCPHGAER